MSKLIKLATIVPSRFAHLTPPNEENIARIAADLVANKIMLNEPHAFREGGTWELLAGHDRVEAARRAGWTEIQVRDFSGTLNGDDAILAHFCRENMLRKETSKAAVAGEWLTRHPDWSDGKVAGESGCTQQYVSDVRAEMIASGNLQHVVSRLGKDEKVRDVGETPRKPRTVRTNVPSKRGIPSPTKTVPLTREQQMRADREAAYEASKTSEAAGASTSSDALGGNVSGDAAGGVDPRDQTEPIAAPEANPSATTPSTGASDSHRVDAARDGEPAPESSPPLSVGDGGLAEVRTVLGLSMRQLTKVELLAITDDEETRLTAIGRYCQQIVTRRRLVCEEAAKEAAKGAAA